MNIAFNEHMMFSLPVDGCTTSTEESAKKEHASEDDTSVSDPSFHNSFDCGKSLEERCFEERDIELSLQQVSLMESSSGVRLDDCLANMKKRLLINVSTNVFYQCYSVEHDRLDPACLSILIMRSIKESK
jgi:hypothetical protein